MAVISTIEHLTGDGHEYISARSAPALPADSVELDIHRFAAFPHVFVGVVLYDGSGNVVVGGSGSFVIEFQTINTMQWEEPEGNPILATQPVTLDAAGNFARVRAVPSSLTGVVSWKLIVTGHRT